MELYHLKTIVLNLALKTELMISNFIFQLKTK